MVDFKRLKTTRRAKATSAASASSATTAAASATTASTPPTSAASASAATGHRLRPTPLLLQIKCTEYRDRALQAARDLRESDTFDKVYLDIDKTQAERAEEYKLRRMRNEENAKLPHEVEGSEGRQRYGIDARSNRKFVMASARAPLGRSSSTRQHTTTHQSTTQPIKQQTLQPTTQQTIQPLTTSKPTTSTTLSRSQHTHHLLQHVTNQNTQHTRTHCHVTSEEACTTIGISAASTTNQRHS